ncbi:MAG: epimerase [Chloroflexi bacterium 13_1_40CM_4_68_4]|nr:MAG: epimerase [Chloroflexi bacterium 13_1_40CM_4_68_4]
MRYLVTGATGFLGGTVARQLVAAGHEVRALVRAPDRARALAAQGVALFAGDVTEPETLFDPMRGVDGIFHLAAWYKVGAKDKSVAERVNLDGTRNVLATARQVGAPKVVYTSTLAVFGDTHGRLVDESYHFDGPFLSEYDRTKSLAHAVAESMAREFMPLVIVQPGVVYGPGDNGPFRPLWDSYLRRRLPVIPAGAAFCWGHVEDTARGHVLAMERGRNGESYILAGPAHTLSEAFEIAERITKIPAPRPIPPALLRAAASVLELFGQDAEALRVMAGTTYLGNSSKAQKELGFDARPLEFGLKETLNYEIAQLEQKGERTAGRTN